MSTFDDEYEPGLYVYPGYLGAYEFDGRVWMFGEEFVPPPRKGDLRPERLYTLAEARAILENESSATDHLSDEEQCTTLHPEQSRNL